MDTACANVQAREKISFVELVECRETLILASGEIGINDTAEAWTFS